MSKTQKHALILVIIAISGAYNCYHYDPIAEIFKASELQKIVLTPNPLELHGDSVSFEISITLPIKMLREKSRYVADFYYAIGDVTKARRGIKPPLGAFKIDTLILEGHQFVKLKKPHTIRKKMTLAYHDTLALGYLQVYVTAREGKRHKILGPTTVLSQEKPVIGVIATSRLVKKPNQVKDSEQGVKAYEAIRSATSRTDGQYQKAYELLQNAPQTAINQFNQGLAYLLEGKNYPAARKALENAEQLNNQDAVIPYALAIVAARTKQEKELITYLKKAFVLKPDLKAKARKDAEFFTYRKKAAFQEALK